MSVHLIKQCPPRCRQLGRREADAAVEAHLAVLHRVLRRGHAFPLIPDDTAPPITLHLGVPKWQRVPSTLWRAADFVPFQNRDSNRPPN